MRRILYIVDGNTTKDTGFSQRILRQMNVIKNIEGIKVDFLNFISLRDLYKNKGIKSDTKQRYSSEVVENVIICIEPPLSLFKSSPDTFFKIKSKRIRKIIDQSNYDLVYCENLRVSYATSLAQELNNNFNYIMDYHGAVPEEFAEFSRSEMGKFNYKYLKLMEEKAIRNSYNIVCVSNYFKDYISNTFNYNKDKIHVIPSCVPANYIGFDKNLRDSLRKSLNIHNKKVIIYAGSVVSYQCIDEMIDLFKGLVEVDNSFYFIFLVANSSKTIITEKFKDRNIKDAHYRVDSVPHKEVLNYCMASDYGIIIRNNSLVNRVSSPTKILEYLATGLPLIITNNIGDFSQYPVTKVELKYTDIINSNINYEKITKLMEEHIDRESNFNNCRDILLKNFVWESQKVIYQSLINR